MISEENYRRMASETLEILKLYPEDKRKKIPKKLLDELEKNRIPDFKVTLDKTKKLYEQDVCEETMVMVYMLYRNYLAKPEDKEEFDKILEEYDDNEK